MLIQFLTCILNLQILREPKILRVRTKAIFQTICFLLTVFMSVSFVNRYMENENSTRIIYKKFHETFEDKYPTYSVCFKGTSFHWLNGLNIYNAFELRAEQYEMMLKGNLALRYEYDSSLKLFRKMPTLMVNGSNVRFDEFHVKISDFLLEANFTTLDQNHSRFFKRTGKHIEHAPPFNINYQTPEMICFARQSTFIPNLIRMEDLLVLSRKLIQNVMYANTELQIFIHYPGQLIRSLAIPSFHLSFPDFQPNKLLSFKLSQSTIIRRRADYREPCNSAIQDYDFYLMTAIINNTECIPSYWKETMRDDSRLKLCTTQHQHHMVYEKIRNWKSIIKNHDQPCVDMHTIVGSNWLDTKDTQKSDEIRMKFSYQEQYYQEIKYLPDFDLETFISNIGGFLGIFLGYSMLQIPEIIGKL